MPAPAQPRRHPLPRGARILLAACVAFGASATASAQTAGDGSAFGTVMETLGLKAKPTRAPAFVERSRPGEAALQYVPVGAPRGAPATKTMTPAEVAAATDALDGARMAQQRRAGVKPAPVPLKPAQGDGAPKKTIR